MSRPFYMDEKKLFGKIEQNEKITFSGSAFPQRFANLCLSSTKLQKYPVPIVCNEAPPSAAKLRVRVRQYIRVGENAGSEIEICAI